MRRFLVCTALALCACTTLADDWSTRQKVGTTFEDTREAIRLAIENRGLVVNYTSHIADMLQRTGTDLGTAQRIYDQAEIIEFCSASLSRQMMQTDPHNIVFCPFAIAIYTLAGEKDGTWVSYRQPQGSAAALVGPLLKEITHEAIE